MSTGSSRFPPGDESPSQGSAGSGGSSGGRVILDAADETAQLVKELTIGTVIDGKYKIDQIIGRGAMGVVLAATHVHLREKVALKFLSARANPNASDFHSRFRREAQVSAKLRNEHITRVIDVGVWRDLLPFMVMDHLTGDDLRRTLKSSPGGKLPVSTALDYVVQLCEGLAEAHAIGIVHRDLKPSNLFVTRRPDGSELIKILDFGISKWSQGEEQLDELTQTGVVLGSPKYMAPEQLFGSSDVDARADVWSIGAIFFEMLTGRPPFDFPTLTRICAELATDKPPPSLSSYGVDVPPELETALLRCFARDRDKRTRNVAELAGALLDAVDAPFADAVQNKIAAVLEPKGIGTSMSTSSGGMPLSGGSYLSLSITGSTPGRMSSSGAIRVAMDAAALSTPSLAPPLLPQTQPADGNRKVIVLGSIIAVLLLAGIFIFFVSGNHPEAPAPRPSAGQTPEPPAPATAAVIAAPSAVAPTNNTADANPAASAAGVVPAGNATPASPPRGGGGGWHPTHHPAPGHAAAPPPANPTPAAPPPPAAPAATPTPQPTTKANPLEDRQ